MSSCRSSRNAMRLLASTMLTSAAAFSAGTGSCNAGTDAILQPLGPESVQTHGLYRQVGTGPLDDLSMVLELDGVALDPNTPTVFTSEEEHTLSLIANGMTFTGFLVRLGAPDFARTIDSLLPVPEETLDGEFSTGGVRIAFETCHNVNFVGGVTHENAAPKRRINMTLVMEEPSNELELDVSVVIRLDESSNVSEWYYSRYILNAVKPDTELPSQSPTSMPTVSQSPTSMPTDGPSTKAPTTDGVVAMSMNAGVLFLSVVGAMWFL